MKNVILALVVTALLSVGAVAVTFAFRSPDVDPKAFSANEFRQEEDAYLASLAGAQPVVLWEPDLAQVEQGRELYQIRCATCHGLDGSGRAVTPEELSTAPRDFTGKSHNAQRVVFKFNTSDRPNMLALDDDLRKTIRDGLPGTDMPGFSALGDSEVDALLEYIKTFGYVAWKYNQPVNAAIQVPSVPQDLTDSDMVDDGRNLFATRGCLACHGDIEQGGQPLQGLVTEWSLAGAPVPIEPRDFTNEPLRRPEPEDIFRSIRLGVKGTPMISNEALSDDDTWSLVAYVLHLRKLGQQP